MCLTLAVLLGITDVSMPGMHDAVLREIIATVKEALPPTYHLTAETGSYNFPYHIVPTDLRPNLVWWNDSQQVIFFAELTISFETSISMAAECKSPKYESIIVRPKENGYIATFIPIQVGSRGIIDLSSFTNLQDVTRIPKRPFSTLLTRVATTAVKGSHEIWCKRNRS